MKIIYLLVSLSLMLTSCYTYKANSSGIQTQNNNIVKVQNPTLVKKKNTVGYIATGLSIAGAGYAGYKYGPIVTNDGNSTNKLDAGNVALGVITGIGLNMIMDKINKNNSYETVYSDEDFNIWLKKVNKNYISLGNSRAIPSNQYKDFSIQNVNDLTDFYKVFKDVDDQYVKEIIAKSNDKLEQNDLNTLINYFPNHPNIFETKKKYVSTSTVYNELINRDSKYPNLGIDIELLASNIINNGNDFVEFNSKYPKSQYFTKVAVNSFKTKYEQYEINKINSNQLHHIFYLNENDFKNNNADKNIYHNFYLSKLSYENVNDFKKYIAFLKSNWINKFVDKNILFDKAWQLGDKDYANGDILIYLLKEYRDLFNSNNYDIEKQIDDKLYNEVVSTVKIQKYNLKRSDNPDFERWRNSNYASFLVKTLGEVAYLVYGEVKNTSKFSLPVKLNTTSEVNLINEGGAAKIVSFVFAGGRETFTPKGKVSNSFNFGYIRPNEIMKFAVLYMLDGSMEGGVDLGLKGTPLSLQFANKIRLDDTKFNFEFSKSYLSSDVIEKQNVWLTLVDRNLPDVEMLDELRSKPYSASQDVLDIEGREVAEEWREALAKSLAESSNRNINVSKQKSSEYIEKINQKYQKIDNYQSYKELSNSSMLNEEGCPCIKYDLKPGTLANHYLYQRKDGKWFYEDNFFRENSPVFDTKKEAIMHYLKKQYPDN